MKSSIKTNTFFTLFLFSATFASMKGQTVNYNYDSSGNLISKIVVQPQKTAVFNFERDSIPVSSDFFAYIPAKMSMKSGEVLNAKAKKSLKTSDSANNKCPSISDNNRKKEL